MRSDVLELMADEINSRPVGRLASFVAFDGAGRAKLDGMGAGKRWDIEREQRDFERASKTELRKLSKRNTNRKYAAAYNESSKAWSKANRARRTKYEREYRLAHKEKEAIRIAKRTERQKADPVRWARRLATWRRYREAKRARTVQGPITQEEATT